PEVDQRDRHPGLAAHAGRLNRRRTGMKYETQKVAYPFFVAALLLFAGQIVFGLLAGAVYVWPNFLAELMPFHILRMSHTNLLVVWLLIGFFGSTYYLLPEEAETEIHSPMIAYVQ